MSSKAKEVGMKEELEVDQARDLWRAKAYKCKHGNIDEVHHNYIPIAKLLSERAEHVTVIMCTKCFHRINLSEIHHFE